MYITDIKVNDGHKSSHFEFDQIEIFQGISSVKPENFVPK